MSLVSRKHNNKKQIIFLFFIILFVVSISLLMKSNDKKFVSTANLGLAEAASIGEIKEYQLLINTTDHQDKNAFQKGDIVMVAAAEKQWSQAEKDGFLIVKVNLTQLQTQILISPKSEELNKKNIRRFKVNLDKIDDTDKNGVVEDKNYSWQEIIIEKQ